MKDLDLEQLGDDMRRRRDELFAEMESEGDNGESARETSPAHDAPILGAEDADEEESEDERDKLDISRTRH